MPVNKTLGTQRRMVKFPQHLLSVYQVQTMHHESLYIEHLPHAIKEQFNNIDGLGELDKELFIDTALSWELGELDMVGYVGLFHLWERYSKDFISRVLDRKHSEWPKLSRMPYPSKVFTHLEGMKIYISHDGICNRCGEKGVSHDSWLINEKIKAGFDRPKVMAPVEKTEPVKRKPVLTQFDMDNQRLMDNRKKSK